jgi:hypothetical protein
MRTDLATRGLEQSVISKLIAVSFRSSIRRTALELEIIAIIGDCNRLFGFDSFSRTQVQGQLLARTILSKLVSLTGRPSIRGCAVSREIVEIVELFERCRG